MLIKFLVVMDSDKARYVRNIKLRLAIHYFRIAVNDKNNHCIDPER